MKGYKDKQFLVFEFSNGKTVKYDLAASMMIGKRGKAVKGLSSQLSGYTALQLIATFEDEKYRAFLNYVLKECSCPSWVGAGTFLSKINSFKHREQFFAAGVTNVSSELRYPLSEIPKDLIRLSQEYGFIINTGAVNQVKLHKDVIRNIYQIKNLRSVSKEDIGRCILGLNIEYNDGRSRAWNIGTINVEAMRKFNQLITVYNYHYESLVRYIDNLMTFEAIEEMGIILRELLDYATMMSAISPRYDKYPKNFLTTHKISARNYNRLKQEFSEELFSNIRDANKTHLQHTIGEYIFTYPHDTQAIKDEAVAQHNCLASYIQHVLDRKCDIIFMRSKERQHESLVTLEVRGGKVVQAEGKLHRELTAKENEIIQQYEQRIQNKRKQGGSKHAA